MNDDLVSRMDKLIGLCPCGAEPRPGEPYCSEDCRPVPGAGVAYYGERWTEWGPAMAAGSARGATAERVYLNELVDRALAHRLIDFAESQGIELTEWQRRFMVQMYAFPQRHVCGAEPQPNDPPPRRRPRLRTCTDGAGGFYTVVTPPRIEGDQ